VNVEFLPEADDPKRADDVAAPHRPNMWRWPLLAVAALALGAVWVATRPAADRPPAKVTQHLTSVSPAPDRVVAACHGVPDCAVRADVPQALDAVVRHYLPTTSTIRVHSYLAVNTLTGGTLLVQRDIDARAGSVSVLISVRRAGNGAREIVDAPLGTGSLVLRRESSGFVVLLQYLAPETVPPTLSQLRLLARDPRLESL
jgi:hypothetical protein